MHGDEITRKKIGKGLNVCIEMSKSSTNLLVRYASQSCAHSREAGRRWAGGKGGGGGRVARGGGGGREARGRRRNLRTA